MVMVSASSLFLFSTASLTIVLHRLPLLTSFHFFTFTWNAPRSLRSAAVADEPCSERLPPQWPEKFVLVQRRVPDADSKVAPNTIVTYYDRTAGANLIQITPDDDGPVRWDLELDNHTSYLFSPSTRDCRVIEFPVGILRSNWLEGATPLGESMSWDGSKKVCGWTKLDFIDYYADKETMEPTSWYFHTMKATFPVLYYAPHESAPDLSMFRPPEYCEEGSSGRVLVKGDDSSMEWDRMRMMPVKRVP